MLMYDSHYGLCCIFLQDLNICVVYLSLKFIRVVFSSIWWYYELAVTASHCRLSSSFQEPVLTSGPDSLRYWIRTKLSFRNTSAYLFSTHVHSLLPPPPRYTENEIAVNLTQWTFLVWSMLRMSYSTGPSSARTWQEVTVCHILTVSCSV